jgi:predicted dinucleotide-binding enzyme
MSRRLSDKVCIITGTGGSVGRAAALAFAHESASVVGCDVNVAAAEATAEMVRSQGGTMVSLQPCHLTKPADCRALVDFALRTYGRIDVLFNNAAMAYFNWLEDITDEEWNRDLREEIDLVFFLTRAAWPHLKASHGVVVNTASLNGLMSFKMLGSLAHTTAKAGIIGLQADIVILAIPFSAVPAIARAGGNWTGKIVIDATNAIDFSAFTPTDLGGRPSSEVVAEKVRGARLVKAFNTLPAAVLAMDPTEGGGHRVLFVSGNDAEANSEVARLVAKFGFAPITLGRLSEGGLLQQFGGPLTIQNLLKLG